MERTISSFGEIELGERLNNILENLETNEDWYSFSPMLATDFQYMYPNAYEDIEEHPNSFREDDHVFAAEVLKYTVQHFMIKS